MKQLYFIKVVFILLLGLVAGLTGYVAHESRTPAKMHSRSLPGIPEGTYLRRHAPKEQHSFSCGALWSKLGAELRVRRDTLCASAYHYAIEKGETPRQFFACGGNDAELLTEFLLIRPGHLRFLCGKDSAVYVRAE